MHVESQKAELIKFRKSQGRAAEISFKNLCFCDGKYNIFCGPCIVHIKPKLLFFSTNHPPSFLTHSYSLPPASKTKRTLRRFGNLPGLLKAVTSGFIKFIRATKQSQPSHHHMGDKDAVCISVQNSNDNGNCGTSTDDNSCCDVASIQGAR